MFVKVCCIASIDEARLAVSAGASAIGLVSAMPSGPGPIAEELIAEIASGVPAPTETFLLTALRDAEAIAEQHRRCGTTALQLVDHVPEPELKRLRRLVPGVRLVQVIHVVGPESVDEAGAAAALVDTLLLDSGNPRLAVKELGGTGRVHDWTHSRRICETTDVPVLLAGGLNAGNVRAAMERVRPAGLDVCSGLRSEGRLDAGKLRDFFRAIH
jgi:phosphoribosylanthranilate isomerase